MKKLGKVHEINKYRQIRSSKNKHHLLRKEFKENLKETHVAFSNYQKLHRRMKATLFSLMFLTAVIILIVLKQFGYL